MLLINRFLVTACLLAVASGSFSQSVIFDNFPADNRLYGRQANNFGIVPISGQATGGYTHLSVVKSRNGVRAGYQKTALTYKDGVASFSLVDSIRAELAQYSFTAYALSSPTDSVVVAGSENNVAGDFYIVYGQSNAVNWEEDYPYRNEYCRSYGLNVEMGGDGWGLSNSIIPRVGIFSITFQREIAERYGIPTCMISGALAGASVFDLSGRNPDNPEDYNTAYGILLSKARASGLLPFIKGIFYWQGETEASSEEPLVWLPEFEKLLGYLQEDYPNVEKIYVFQLPLFGGGEYDDRIGQFREDQRTLYVKYPIVQPYAPGGATGWDGFHYWIEGSVELGKELADMAGYNHYGSKTKISSPNFRKAFYSNPERSEISVVFDDHQTMVWPKDSTYANIEVSEELYSTYRVKDFFYLNKEWRKLESGRAEANKVIVTLKEVKEDTLIKYLPSKYHYAGLTTAPWVYLGPFLKNTHGFRALAFHHNPIAPYVDFGTISLTGTENESGGVDLAWNKLPPATSYQLERLSDADPEEPHRNWHLDGDKTTFTDYTGRKGITYRYRVRGYTEKNESEISKEVIVEKTIESLILGNEPRKSEDLITAYPNPTRDFVLLESKSGVINEVMLFSAEGRLLHTRKFGQVKAELDLRSYPPGLYFLKIQAADQLVFRKILVR